jgi:GTP-binding protein
LLTKARILAISKCDIADPEIDLEQLTKKLSEELEIPVITFSSASGTGLTELKDMLWEELDKEQNQVIGISHAPMEVKLNEHDEEIEDEDDEPHTIYLNEVEEEWDLDKYRGLGWDTQEE